jgi:hypothetical protein
VQKILASGGDPNRRTLGPAPIPGEASLSDQPLSAESAAEPFRQSVEDWEEFALWCSRLELMNEGVEFEARSTPISDDDISNVNVAG